MATLNEIERLLEEPVATEGYATELEAALTSIEGDTSVRAMAYKQIGADILSRVREAVSSGGELDNLVVLKNGKVFMEPGAKPLTIEQVAAGHELYVLHTTRNVVEYDDGIPDDTADIFAGMRSD